jgi:hypothetical protein
LRAAIRGRFTRQFAHPRRVSPSHPRQMSAMPAPWPPPSWISPPGLFPAVQSEVRPGTHTGTLVRLSRKECTGRIKEAWCAPGFASYRALSECRTDQSWPRAGGAGEEWQRKGKRNTGPEVAASRKANNGRTR